MSSEKPGSPVLYEVDFANMWPHVKPPGIVPIHSRGEELVEEGTKAFIDAIATAGIVEPQTIEQGPEAQKAAFWNGYTLALGLINPDTHTLEQLRTQMGYFGFSLGIDGQAQRTVEGEFDHSDYAEALFENIQPVIDRFNEAVQLDARREELMEEAVLDFNICLIIAQTNKEPGEPISLVIDELIYAQNMMGAGLTWRIMDLIAEDRDLALMQAKIDQADLNESDDGETWFDKLLRES